jgi:hypothetical protein
MMTDALRISLILVVVVFSVAAQTTTPRSLKLSDREPSVYISFERVGKSPPLFEGESNNRVWLRLHNNIKLPLFFCKFDVDQEYGDLGLFYKVEGPLIGTGSNIFGYGQTDDCDVYTLKSGKSVVFSIPKEHLKEGQTISTSFAYGWTGKWETDMYERTFHQVKFSSEKKLEKSDRQDIRTTVRRGKP